MDTSTLSNDFNDLIMGVHSIREAVFLSDRVLVMSARPGTIIENLVVPFERPRDFSLVETPEFNKICAHLRGKIDAQH